MTMSPPLAPVVVQLVSLHAEKVLLVGQGRHGKQGQANCQDHCQAKNLAFHVTAFFLYL